MKLIHTLFTLLLAFLMTSPAFAVNPNGDWYAIRYNNAGTTGFAMRPHATNFCFLTQVSIEETDSGGEEAHCRVVRLGSDWWLQAILDKSSDADVKCRAACYTRN